MVDITIIIADDHTVAREGMRHILEKEPDLKIIGEATNGEETVKLAAALKPDLAIVDVSMPVMDGIEATRQIRKNNPSTAVLILSAYDNDEYVFPLLEAGAAGYLLKEAKGQDIVDAIRAICRGGSVLYPMITTKVINRFFPPPNDNKESAKIIGERELEVLHLAYDALTNQEIADKLGISLHTVESHMRHIFDKLQVNSRTEAIIFALKQGWINLDKSPQHQD